MAGRNRAGAGADPRCCRGGAAGAVRGARSGGHPHRDDEQVDARSHRGGLGQLADVGDRDGDPRRLDPARVHRREGLRRRAPAGPPDTAPHRGDRHPRADVRSPRLRAAQDPRPRWPRAPARGRRAVPAARVRQEGLQPAGRVLRRAQGRLLRRHQRQLGAGVRPARLHDLQRRAGDLERAQGGRVEVQLPRAGPRRQRVGLSLHGSVGPAGAEVLLRAGADRRPRRDRHPVGEGQERRVEGLLPLPDHQAGGQHAEADPDDVAGQPGGQHADLRRRDRDRQPGQAADQGRDDRLLGHAVRRVVADRRHRRQRRADAQGVDPGRPRRRRREGARRDHRLDRLLPAHRPVDQRAHLRPQGLRAGRSDHRRAPLGAPAAGQPPRRLRPRGQRRQRRRVPRPRRRRRAQAVGDLRGRRLQRSAVLDQRADRHHRAARAGAVDRAVPAERPRRPDQAVGQLPRPSLQGRHQDHRQARRHRSPRRPGQRARRRSDRRPPG